MTIVPKFSCTLAQTFDTNAGPLSVVAISHSPNVLTHDLMNALAHSSAVCVFMGMASTQRDVRSNMVRMYEFPSDGVTGPIMSSIRSEKRGANTGLCLVGGEMVRPTLTS